jgi:hypothetical protein
MRLRALVRCFPDGSTARERARSSQPRDDAARRDRVFLGIPERVQIQDASAEADAARIKDVLELVRPLACGR